MKKWELARYLIDAKKCVDSISYIGAHVKELKHLNLRENVQDSLRKFYINLRTVYCDCFSNKERKDLKKSDSIFEKTMYEADKNYAHKDPNYNYKEIESFSALIDDLKNKITHCREICSSHLPDVLTLDFVEHDPILFRFLNKIDVEKEEELLKLLHPCYGQKIEETSYAKTYKVFNDTEQIKTIEKPEEYAAIISEGLTQRESIQTRQDGCIRVNVLNGTNIWMHPNWEVLNEMKNFLEEIGLGFLF